MIGHWDTLGALRGLATGRTLAHALLITGPDGVGKTTLALLLAADLVCLSPGDDGAACGECRSCELAAAESHPDILRISPPKEETTIGQMRDLRYTASLVPSLSSRRVIIIERAETLNDQAANAILKVLEDAPPHLVLVLLAPATESVLPTIRSRSVHVPLHPVPASQILERLMQEGLEEAEAEALCAFSGGAPGRAVALAASPQLRSLIGEIRSWLETASQAGPARALRLAEELRGIAEQARKELPGEDGSTDRQAFAWTLDALMGAMQTAMRGRGSVHAAGAVQRWGSEGLAALSADANQARRMILSYAQADLQLERLAIRFVTAPRCQR